MTSRACKEQNINEIWERILEILEVLVLIQYSTVPEELFFRSDPSLVDVDVDSLLHHMPASVCDTVTIAVLTTSQI